MAFNIPTQVSSYKYRPVSPLAPWERAGDWITITDTPGEVQFLTSDLCMGKYSINTVFTQTGGVGNIYIDWGDGTTNTISTIAATTTNHTYTIGGGTACSRGYTTFKVRIYGDSGTRITKVNFLPPFTGKANSVSYGVLEAYYGDTTITDTNNLWGFGGNNSGATFLEYVKMPAIMAAVDMDSAFYGCTALAEIVMPTSMSTINLRSTFRSCVLLRSLEFPPDAILGDCFNGFNGCSALVSVTLPSSVTSITSLSGTFSSCFSLGNIIFPTGLNSCTSFSSTFSSCQSLITVEIPGFYTGVVTNDVTLVNCFSSCVSLQYVKLPNTYRSGLILGLSSTFASCRSLLSMDLSKMPDISTMSGTFSSASALSTVTLPTSCPSLTSLVSAFSDTGIQEITLPTTVGATIAINSAFSGCLGLSSVTIPSGYIITNMTSAFSGCRSINTINLPANSQNSITDMTSAFFNCNSLINLTLPTSMTGVTNLTSAFRSCTSLTSVTLPSTMNSCTTITLAFSDCSNLISVTLPTSMSACISLQSIFTNCAVLTSVTFPATVSASLTTYQSAVQRCYSLKTLTLPTTQTSLLNSLSNTFNACMSLTTINNTANLGSTSAGSTIYINGISNDAMDSLTTLSFSCKFSQLQLQGTVSISTALTSLRLLNNGAGQYASGGINVSYTSLGAVALDQLFTDLPTIVSKTITITGTPGAATCTRSIATAKGWTVTG